MAVTGAWTKKGCHSEEVTVRWDSTVTKIKRKATDVG